MNRFVLQAEDDGLHDDAWTSEEENEEEQVIKGVKRKVCRWVPWMFSEEETNVLFLWQQVLRRQASIHAPLQYMRQARWLRGGEG